MIQKRQSVPDGKHRAWLGIRIAPQADKITTTYGCKLGSQLQENNGETTNGRIEARIRYVAITRVWVACSILRFSQIYYGHSFQWRKLIFFQFAEVCLQYKTNNQLF